MLSLTQRTLGSTVRCSSGLLLQILRQCSGGDCRNASTSSRAASITGTAPGNCLRSISVSCCQFTLTYSYYWITNTAYGLRPTTSTLPPPPCPGRLWARGSVGCARSARGRSIYPAHIPVRLQEQPWNIRMIAAVKLSWASEISSRVPANTLSSASQPAAMSEPRNWCQKPSTSLSPTAKPRTSR